MVTSEHPICPLFIQKFWEISRQIHEFMTWTQVKCPFEKDKKIQSYLLTAPIYSEEGEAASAQQQPPPCTSACPCSPDTLGGWPDNYPHTTQGKFSPQGEFMRVGHGQLTDEG